MNSVDTWRRKRSHVTAWTITCAQLCAMTGLTTHESSAFIFMGAARDLACRQIFPASRFVGIVDKGFNDTASLLLVRRFDTEMVFVDQAAAHKALNNHQDGLQEDDDSEPLY